MCFSSNVVVFVLSFLLNCKLQQITSTCQVISYIHVVDSLILSFEQLTLLSTFAKFNYLACNLTGYL